MEYTHQDQLQQRDVLAELEAMVDFLETAFAGLTPAQRLEGGASDSFSPIEHVWHLADLEQLGFAERIRRLQLEEFPHLADFEGARIAREGRYRERSWSEGIEAFRSARAGNLAKFRALDAEQWQRRGTQQGVGPVAMSDIPALMAAHDAAHREEITAWIQWHKS